jgi:Concanavalin A-like lectin/glucanases superfamily
MATITGLTADRMIAIENASVVDGDVVGDNLILTTKGGTQINAGSVRGPQGAQGPVGSALPVVTSKQILDVGLSGQVRAGRQLTATDFTNMGLAAPLGLWNLSNLNDSSGNGRNLSNKGGVPFSGVGIEGVAASSAQFVGLTTQALYIPDTGASDPFRIKTGSWGCWFRGSKRSVSPQSTLISKLGASGQYSFEMHVTLQNQVIVGASTDGTGFPVATGISDVMDNRWHFAVGTYDGSKIAVYIDGILENMAVFAGVLFGSSAPLNIGGRGADGSAANGLPHFGQIDEAFITSEILSEDQVRNLYCVKIPHTLSAIPKNVGLNVRRRKKGAALAASDFSTQPLRLYNFSAGSLNDEGSNGQALTNSGGAISVPGVDGSLGNAYHLTGANQLVSTDAGLPSALASRSFGCWVKHPTTQNSPAIMSWGSGAGTTAHTLYINTSGIIVARSYADDMAGPLVTDGLWHFVVVTEDNASLDGAKRKLYVDGRLTSISTGMTSIGLGGANRFRLGQWPDGTGTGTALIGQIDGVFVCDYILDIMQIMKLYTKGAQALGVSPKNPGDHVELMTNTDLFCLFDTLPTQHQVDLVVT